MSIESKLHRLEVLDQRVALLQQERDESLISLISEIQKEKKVESLEFSPRTGFPEYYSNYSQNTYLVLAVKVEGQSILVRVNVGNGNHFFDPNQDGKIVQDLTPYLSKYVKKPLYRLGIIDHSVSIPEDIDKEYDSIDEAYEALSKFVHSYDGIMQVDGRVMDEDDEDVEYASSIM